MDCRSCFATYYFLNNIARCFSNCFPAREAAGENPLRNTNFLAKVRDEVEDLGGLQIFSNPAGADMGYYDLNYDQMMLVGIASYRR